MPPNAPAGACGSRYATPASASRPICSPIFSTRSSNAVRRMVRQFGGLGLGLAIAKALIELHHGQIRVASDGVGKGATFIIELPEPGPRMENQNAKIDLGASRTPASLRLLLVEDHVDTSRMLVKLLGSAGYTVRTASDAAGALELAANEPFDLILSDIGLPDASGYHSDAADQAGPRDLRHRHERIWDGRGHPQEPGGRLQRSPRETDQLRAA